MSRDKDDLVLMSEELEGMVNLEQFQDGMSAITFELVIPRQGGPELKLAGVALNVRYEASNLTIMGTGVSAELYLQAISWLRVDNENLKLSLKVDETKVLEDTQVMSIETLVLPNHDQRVIKLTCRFGSNT